MGKKCPILLTGIMAILLFSQSLRQNPVYVKSDNIFAGVFTEPFETMCVVCANGDRYFFTTHEEKKVNMSPEFVRIFLQNKGHKLEDVTTIVHNHFGYPRISIENKKFLRMLRKFGFYGRFGVIETSSNKFIWAKE